MRDVSIWPGFSGGARFSTGIALGSTDIAGVIASSAGFPDSLPHDSANCFPIFGTAGTEDFNYIEMRLLDHKLSSPHYLAVFHGGPRASARRRRAGSPSSGWSFSRCGPDDGSRDEAVLHELLEKRRAKVAAASADVVETLYGLTAAGRQTSPVSSTCLQKRLRLDQWIPAIRCGRRR